MVLEAHDCFSCYSEPFISVIILSQCRERQQCVSSSIVTEQLRCGWYLSLLHVHFVLVLVLLGWMVSALVTQCGNTGH